MADIDALLGRSLGLLHGQVGLLALDLSDPGLGCSVDVGEVLLHHAPEQLLQVDGLVVHLRGGVVVQLAVLPAQLDVVQCLLDGLVLGLVVLPADLVEVDGFLDYLLVVSQTQG